MTGPGRPLRSPSVAAGAAVLATASAAYLVYVLPLAGASPAILVMLAATVLLAGWALSPAVPVADNAAAGPADDRRGSVWRRRLGVAVFALSAIAAAIATPTFHDRWPRLLPIWLICMGSALAGAAIVGRLGAAPPAGPRPPARHRALHAAAFLFCLVVGVGFRLYRLHDMPPGIWVDETNIAMDALMLLDGRPDSPFGVGWWETPTLYAYYMAGVFKLFGVNFWALKLVSLIPAVLALVVIYPVGRLLFGARAALLAMFLMAVSSWHITMSRWAFAELMPPTFQLASTALLLLAFRTTKALHFSLAGLVLGLGMYTYLASRLVVGVIIVYLLYRIVFDRGFLRQHWAGLVFFGLGYLLCFGPLLTTYAQNAFALLNRSQQISIFRDVQHAGDWSPLLENAQRHLLMFHARGDANPRHNVPGHPMLTAVPAVLTLLGVGLALWRLRDHRFFLLLAWIGVTLQGGILSTLAEGPQAFRTIGVVPALCLLGGVTAEAWRRTLAVGRALAVLGGGVVVGALLYDTTAAYHRYFVEHAGVPGIDIAFNHLENNLARRLIAERDATGTLGHVYLSPRFYFFSQVRYFLYQPRQVGHGGLEDPPYHVIEPQSDLPLAVEPTRDLLMLLEPDLAGSLDLIKRYYPHLDAHPVGDPIPLYLEVHIPRADVAALRGLTVYDTNGRPGPETKVDQTGTIAERLTGLRPGQALAGSFRAARSGWYGFSLEGPVRLELDRQPARGFVYLGQGLHDIRLIRTSDGGRAQITVQPPGEAVQPLSAGHVFAIAAPRQGFRGRYYAGLGWHGDPVFERIDPVLVFAWPGDEPLPDPFSAQWDGRVTIAGPGEYTFEAQCDDGCALAIDGETVAQGLEIGVNVIRAKRLLAAGTHDLTATYFQNGGGKSFRLLWSPPGRPLEPLPAALVTPAPPGPLRTSATAPAAP